MRIKLDENLPFQLAAQLGKLGHDVHTIFDEGLYGNDDQKIWEAANKESRFLITQDLDFSDIRQFAPGNHAGILLVRLRSANRLNLVARVAELFKKEDVDNWQACFCVATERKIRIRRPLKPPTK